MKQGYYITASGEKFIVESKNTINICSRRDIVELHIPDGCIVLYCSYNLLTELTLPDNIREVSCHHNQLTELIIPEGCKSIWCWDNRLTKLVIPDGCKEVYCDISLIEKHLDEWKHLETYITNVR
jgi:hypothetical protein